MPEAGHIVLHRLGIDRPQVRLAAGRQLLPLRGQQAQTAEVELANGMVDLRDRGFGVRLGNRRQRLEAVAMFHQKCGLPFVNQPTDFGSVGVPLPIV